MRPKKREIERKKLERTRKILRECEKIAEREREESIAGETNVWRKRQREREIVSEKRNGEV